MKPAPGLRVPSIKLRWYLLVLTLVTVLPMVALAMVAAGALVRRERETFERGATERTRALMTAVDAELRGSITTLTALATLRALDHDDLRGFQAEAARVLAGKADWLTIRLALPSGRQVLDVRNPHGASPGHIVDQGSFDHVLRTRTGAVGGVVRREPTAPYYFPVRVAVVRDGAIRYVLFAEVSPGSIEALLASQRLPPEWVGVVVDAAGRIVTRTVAPERTAGQPASESLRAALAGATEGWFHGRTLEGTVVYTPFTRSDFSGWTVAMGIPAPVVEASARRALWRLVAGFALASLAAVGLAVLLGRVITRPIASLAALAQSLGHGPPPALPAPCAVTEVDHLSRALDEAVAALRARDETQGRLAAIVEASSDAIIGLTLDGVVATWNPAAHSLFGYSAEEACGRHVSFLAPPERADEPQKLLAAVERGETITGTETVWARRDGTAVAVSVSLSAIRDAGGRVTRLAAAVRDVGARQRAEAALRASEVRARQLLASEQQARREAELASRAKDEFLAMLGHELRNPLGAITSAVHLLGRIGSPEPRAAQARDVIARQAEHLARLVDDLLDVGRVVTGKIALQHDAVDLADLTRRVVESFRAAGRIEGHTVTVDTRPAWIMADAVRLEQVVGNLLTNALKYTPAGGAIRVRVEPADGEAVLAVEDSGIGIPRELLPRVFDLFVQGDRSLARAQGGLGVGLTLVQRLVALHGGQVEVTSPGPGRGSAFTVRLPLAGRPVPGAPVPPAPVAAPPPNPRHILLVEDNDDARETLRRLLELEGHVVHEAEDGADAVEVALRERPEVALIDIGLPGLDGYEVARRIRWRPEGQRIVLVALTGYGTQEDHARSQRAGFDAHLVKPVDPAVLARTLARIPPRTDGP